MSERVGFWADMESPYITYENDYIESVWWSLKRIHEEGLLYKGHKVVPYRLRAAARRFPPTRWRRDTRTSPRIRCL